MGSHVRGVKLRGLGRVSGPIVPALKGCAVLAALLLALASPAAADGATVAAAGGSVRLVRDGKVRYDAIGSGFRLESFDLIRTNAGSSVEIDLDPRAGIDVTVLVDADTALMFGLSSSGGDQPGAIELIAGAVEVTSRGPSGSSEFRILTSSATIAVRETSFAVTTASDGAILVAARTGIVEVTLPDGRTLDARPGMAVEVDRLAGLFRSVRIADERYRAFRGEWLDRRNSALVSDASSALQGWQQEYRTARDAFEKAYSVLMEHRALIDEWVEAAWRGVRLGDVTALERGNMSTEWDDVSDALNPARIAAFRFETAVASLERLSPYVDRVAVEIAELYRGIANDRQVMEARLATVRHALKLHAEQHHSRSHEHEETVR